MAFPYRDARTGELVTVEQAVSGLLRHRFASRTGLLDSRGARAYLPRSRTYFARGGAEQWPIARYARSRYSSVAVVYKGEDLVHASCWTDLGFPWSGGSGRLHAGSSRLLSRYPDC
jgi:hypothetical protein